MPFTRRESALVATAAALVFSRVFGISVVMPGFVAYARSLPGATDLWVGIAFGAYGLTLALMQLPMGWLSDHIGRKPVLLFGTALFVIGSAWAALAPTMGHMLAARLVQGLGAVSSAAMAMVGETLPPERRTLGMAMVGIPAGLGFFIGLMAAGGLDFLGVNGLFWLAAGMGTFAGLPLLFLPVHAPRITSPPVGALGPSVLSLAAAGFVMNFALTSVLFFLGVAGRSTGSNLLWPLFGALVVMALLSRQVDRRGWTWQPIIWGLAILALGAALSVRLPAGPWVLGAFVFFAAHATLSAVIPSQVSRLAGPSGGRGHGIQNIVAYSGTFAAGALGGATTQRPSVALAVLAVLAASVAGLCLLRWYRDSVPTQTRPSGSEQG